MQQTKVVKYSLLRSKIVEKFGTQQAFAKALGINPTTLNQKLNRRSSWTFWEVAKACELLGIPLVDAPLYFPRLDI